MYLALAAVIKEESLYIREWVTWHAMHGADYFFIVDNNHHIKDSDRTRDVLHDYIKAGMVRIERQPIKRIDFQHDAYQFALNEIGDRCVWMACIDIDEFLFPTSCLSLLEFLRLQEKIKDLGSIHVSIATFGTSFLKHTPLSRVQSLTRRAEKNFLYNQRGKTIIRPWRTWSAGITKGMPMVNPYKCYCTDGSVYKSGENVIWNWLRLNHYETGSEECWNRKVNKGPGPGQIPIDRKRNLLFKSGNLEVDSSAVRYAGKLIDRMNTDHSHRQ